MELTAAHPISGRKIEWTLLIASGDMLLTVGLCDTHCGDRARAERAALRECERDHPERSFVVLDAARHF